MSALDITRRDLLKSAGIAAAAAALPRAASAAPARRPNILLYVVDDQGMDDAGCYGNPVVRTPGLDTLAREGVRFTHAFCTTASCSASRSVILTGLYNHANGQYGHAHSFHHFVTHSNVKSLPVLLAASGYRTAAWGKYHVAPEKVYHFENYIRGGGSPEKGADRCRPFVAAAGDRPFFLYFCTHEPHRPFKREGSDPIDPKDVLVPSYLPDSPECREELARYYMSVQRADRGLLRLIEILKETGRWDDTVTIYCSDNGIAFPGAKTNLYEPAMRLPFVVRDPYQEERGAVGSTTLSPPRGQTSDAMVNYADITPTLLDFAGATPEKHRFHGRSFRSACASYKNRGEKTEGWDEIFASHTFHEITMYYPMRVVRGRRWKLIWNVAHGLDYPHASDLWASPTWKGVLRRGEETYGRRSVASYLKRPRFELYDLENDPDETANLADDPAHAAVLEGLKRRLKEFQKRTDDPWIVKWVHE